MDLGRKSSTLVERYKRNIATMFNIKYYYYEKFELLLSLRELSENVIAINVLEIKTTDEQ